MGITRRDSKAKGQLEGNGFKGPGERDTETETTDSDQVSRIKDSCWK